MTSLSTQSRTEAAGRRFATWAPLTVILFGTFVYVLDFFIVNVALPDIQRSLAASAAAIEWVVAGYGLTSAAFLVTGGRLGDHYGRRKLFCAGIAIFTAALVAIVLPLLDGREQGWPAWSWACLAAGIVTLAVFAAHLRAMARRGGQPLLDPAIFAVRAFRAGLICQVLFWCQQAASYLLLALYLQEGRGLSPMKSGGVFAVLAAGYLATSLRAPALTMRFGRRVVATGALIAALGDVLLVLAAVPGDGGLAQAGPLGALFPSEFFEVERSEVTLFAPVEDGAQAGRLGPGRVRLTKIAGTEAAVAVHDGPAQDIDRTYGALGTAVAERAIGVDGPIREYYPDGFESEPHRTEICWPVFLTGAGLLKGKPSQ